MLRVSLFAFSHHCVTASQAHSDCQRDTVTASDTNLSWCFHKVVLMKAPTLLLPMGAAGGVGLATAMTSRTLGWNGLYQCLLTHDNTCLSALCVHLTHLWVCRVLQLVCFWVCHRLQGPRLLVTSGLCCALRLDACDASELCCV